MTTSIVERNKQVVRTSGGVYVMPGHWAARSVHSFHRWTGESTLVTWCGLDCDLEAGARLTPDLITCVSCGEASWQALRHPAAARTAQDGRMS